MGYREDKLKELERYADSLNRAWREDPVLVSIVNEAKRLVRGYLRRRGQPTIASRVEEAKERIATGFRRTQDFVP